MLRDSARARASLLVTCLVLASAPPALAQSTDARERPPVPPALIGGGVLLGLAVAAWACSQRSATERQRERAERERIAKLLASLEREHLARMAERQRLGLVRRRRPTLADRRAPRLESGAVSFTRRGGGRRGPQPAAAPPATTADAERPAPAPTPPAPAPAPVDAASERLAKIVEAIADAERRLATLSARVEGAERTGAPTPATPGMRTIDLGPIELPDVEGLLEDLGEEQGGRTLRVAPLELPDVEGLLDDLGEEQGGRTLRVAPLELPTDQLEPDTQVLVPDELLNRFQALADVPVPDGSFTPVIAPTVPRPPASRDGAQAS